MKRNILLNAALTIVTAFGLMALPACKKDDVTPEPTKTQLITKANWKMAKVETKNPAGTWVDITSSIDACELDNILAFNSNLSYVINEGATKCDISDPHIYETGTWKFANNETQVSFTEAGSTTADLADIVKITTDALVFTKTYNDNGTVYNYQVSYKH